MSENHVTHTDDKPVKHVVLDFSGVSFVDSVGCKIINLVSYSFI